ncbi:hypothetical protein MA16_Dca028755 [Dendrobium catenatum]|uniref:Uncharacterized protein n=1 Tax=Dendrobium catenatum TaxID=906689 RepID=A0A2I0VG35_9ASPA|nr:hypothetical protein MA16_Dca028755 [Dendrobium catenatum]
MAWKSQRCRRRRFKGNIPRVKESTVRANQRLVDDDDDKSNRRIGREKGNEGFG